MYLTDNRVACDTVILLMYLTDNRVACDIVILLMYLTDNRVACDIVILLMYMFYTANVLILKLLTSEEPNNNHLL